MSEAVLFEEVVQPGATWSHIVKRGTALRITDPEGGANVAAIFYNAENPTERYNMPDTLKAQHIARLTKGFVLYSDMGRILFSITGDTAGWHDPIAGCSNAAIVGKRYGFGDYQTCRNDYYKNTRDSFLVELGKYGLGPRDLVPNMNFFSKVVADTVGTLRFEHSSTESGTYVELRAEMNVLTILNTCQHPLDPNPKYEPKAVHLSLRRVAPAGPDDLCRVSRPENGRGFTLTERYYL